VTDPGNTDVVISFILWHFHQGDKAFSVVCLPISSPLILGFILSIFCNLYVYRLGTFIFSLVSPEVIWHFHFFPIGILMSSTYNTWPYHCIFNFTNFCCCASTCALSIFHYITVVIVLLKISIWIHFWRNFT
jgi:hypothetical protein